MNIAESHDLIVISDEIYDQLVYGWQHVSFAALPGAWDRTLTLGGFSKDYAMTGWRIGFAAAPAEILKGCCAFTSTRSCPLPPWRRRLPWRRCESGKPYVEQMVARVRPATQADRRAVSTGWGCRPSSRAALSMLSPTRW